MKLLKTGHVGHFLVVLLALCLAAVSSAASGGRCAAAGEGAEFGISLEAGWMRPADLDFRELYGRAAFLPEVRISKGLGSGMSAWLAVSGFKGSGTIPVLDEPAEARQIFLSLGASLERALLGGLSGRADAGLTLIAYRESALGAAEKGTRAGFRCGAGLSYPIYRGLSATASAGYILSSKTLGGVSMKFGGFKAGLGLAYRFD